VGHRSTLIATMWIAYSGVSQTTVLFSHGNATDLGYMRDHLIELAEILHVNVLAYDYSGYGLSNRRASAAHCYDNILSVYQYLITSYPSFSDYVIAYGQSLGSGPSLYLSTKVPLAGLIIHSGLTSCLRVLDPHLTNTPFYDLFPNIDLIQRSLQQPPVFIIHGAADTEIPTEHATQLQQRVTHQYPIWLVNEAGHNDIELKERKQYHQQLQQFISYVQTQRPNRQQLQIKQQQQQNNQKNNKNKQKQQKQQENGPVTTAPTTTTTTPAATGSEQQLQQSQLLNPSASAPLPSSSSLSPV